jgi:hypothetical protein
MTERNALAYLDGGPASGVTIELNEPAWAPLRSVRVEVGGVETVYVRVPQRTPRPGEPWRYVPEDSPDAQAASTDEDAIPERDPFDD